MTRYGAQRHHKVPMTVDHRGHHEQKIFNLQQSSAINQQSSNEKTFVSSTASSSSTSSATSHADAQSLDGTSSGSSISWVPHVEAVPSRTIAIQCDLKPSSRHSPLNHQTFESHEASFYNARRVLSHAPEADNISIATQTVDSSSSTDIESVDQHDYRPSAHINGIPPKPLRTSTLNLANNSNINQASSQATINRPRLIRCDENGMVKAYSNVPTPVPTLNNGYTDDNDTDNDSYLNRRHSNTRGNVSSDSSSSYQRQKSLSTRNLNQIGSGHRLRPQFQSHSSLSDSSRSDRPSILPARRLVGQQQVHSNQYNQGSPSSEFRERQSSMLSGRHQYPIPSPTQNNSSSHSTTHTNDTYETLSQYNRMRSSPSPSRHYEDHHSHHRNHKMPNKAHYVHHLSQTIIPSKEDIERADIGDVDASRIVDYSNETGDPILVDQLDRVQRPKSALATSAHHNDSDRYCSSSSEHGDLSGSPLRRAQSRPELLMMGSSTLGRAPSRAKSTISNDTNGSTVRTRSKLLSFSMKNDKDIGPRIELPDRMPNVNHAQRSHRMSATGSSELSNGSRRRYWHGGARSISPSEGQTYQKYPNGSRDLETKRYERSVMTNGHHGARSSYVTQDGTHQNQQQHRSNSLDRDTRDINDSNLLSPPVISSATLDTRRTHRSNRVPSGSSNLKPARSSLLVDHTDGNGMPSRQWSGGVKRSKSVIGDGPPQEHLDAVRALINGEPLPPNVVYTSSSPSRAHPPSSSPLGRPSFESGNQQRTATRRDSNEDTDRSGHGYSSHSSASSPPVDVPRRSLHKSSSLLSSRTAPPVRGRAEPSAYFAGTPTLASSTATRPLGARSELGGIRSTSHAMDLNSTMGGRRAHYQAPTMDRSQRRPLGSASSLIERYERARAREPIVALIPHVPRDQQSTSNTLKKNKNSSSSPTSQFNTRAHRLSNESLNGRMPPMREAPPPLRYDDGQQRRSRRSVRSGYLEANYDDEDDDEEQQDEIGQLASEMNDAHLKRRHSVPKDAKLNWFAKLKQKVSSK